MSACGYVPTHEACGKCRGFDEKIVCSKNMETHKAFLDRIDSFEKTKQTMKWSILSGVHQSHRKLMLITHLYY